MPVTYTPIATSTVSGSSTAVVTFSSIPSTYTDLIVVSNISSSTSLYSLYGQFNGDVAGNYSWTYAYGDGTTTASGRFANAGGFIASYYVTPTPSFDSNAITHIFNYSNTTTYKTVISRGNSNSGTYPGTEMSVSMWRNTAAINSVTIYQGAGNMIAGSTITIYGIKAA
jgi:hypothetical protein